MTDALPDTTPIAAPDAASDLKAQADKLVAEGKKAIALKNWEEGVEKYADALDLMRQIVGEFDPAMAPLLLSYGKALYELAFASQGVMGKEEVDKQASGIGREEEQVASSSNFVFSADPVSDDEEGEDTAAAADDAAPAGESSGNGEGVSAAEGADGAEGAEGAAGEEGVDEPEDDYNAAWEVLDVARTIYSKIVEELPEGQGREERLWLAECYLALGDVSLETENFPQAVTDYTSALEIKEKLLSPSSRALASVHYQLATVLEFTPNGRPTALSHVETALSGFKARLEELTSGEKLNEELGKMSEKERDNEKKDVEALIGDLEVKIEELKLAPVQGDLVSESINHLLGRPGSSSSAVKEDTGPVNDLTSMVKKKPKKAAPPPAAAAAEIDGKGKAVENGEKRKAEENGEEAASKKQKAE